VLLGALGTLVWDRVLHPSGAEPVEQWGGAVYSLAALSASCPDGWRVEAILKIGQDLADSALERLRELPGVGIGSGVRVVPEANNRVELRYQDSAHRHEVLTGGVPPWEWDELDSLVRPLDALYVNFLSGFEMGLETAERLRRGYRGPIYADLHSLFLGPAGDRPRAPRPLPRWQRWLACFDAVQLNGSELALLLGSEHADPAELLEHGPSLVLVTLGEQGARFAARARHPEEEERWRALPVPAPSDRSGLIPPPGGAVGGDPTGCGDVWGSVLWTGLLAGLSLPAAMRRAHRAAAAKIRQPATRELHRRLREALLA
jgi:sugar/nucleoside kinase (ribokinase family)